MRRCAGYRSPPDLSPDSASGVADGAICSAPIPREVSAIVPRVTRHTGACSNGRSCRSLRGSIRNSSRRRVCGTSCCARWGCLRVRLARGSPRRGRLTPVPTAIGVFCNPPPSNDFWPTPVYLAARSAPRVVRTLAFIHAKIIAHRSASSGRYIGALETLMRTVSFAIRMARTADRHCLPHPSARRPLP